MAMEIEELYDKIYRYCYFHIGCQHQAEDLTQETFLRYFRRKPTLHQGKQLAYLYTIARNLCVDSYRKRKEEEFPQELIVEPMEGVEELLDLKKSVEKLSVDMQEIIMLRYGNGVSVGETARILGISRFVVYRKEKEALKQLKIMLEGGS